MLQETVLALLRNPSYCVYGAASSTSVQEIDDAEARFNKESLEERSKFQEETFSNFSGMKRTRSSRAANPGQEVR